MSDAPSPDEAQTPDAEETAQAPGTRDPVRFALRIVLYGALLIMLVLAGMDFLTKQAAQKTGRVWADMLQDRDSRNEDLSISALEANMSGEPRVSRDVVGRGAHTRSYIWSGIFREYEIRVALDKEINPGDPVVMEINPQW